MYAYIKCTGETIREKGGGELIFRSEASRDGLIPKTGPKLNLKPSQISVSFLSIFFFLLPPLPASEGVSLHTSYGPFRPVRRSNLSLTARTSVFAYTQIVAFSLFTIRRRQKRVPGTEKYSFQLFYVRNANKRRLSTESLHARTVFLILYSRVCTYTRETLK